MLTNEQWKQAPTWARWHAFDENKEAYWYDKKPKLSGHNPFWIGMGNKDQRSSIFLDENTASWKETREPRPFDTYPCPFCGGTDLEITEDNQIKSNAPCFFVSCNTRTEEGRFVCCTGPIRNSEDDAWQAWATRV